MRSLAAALAAALLLLAGALAGCTAPAPSTVSIQEGFEDGLGSWRSGFHLPVDPNKPGGDFVDWHIDTSDERARSGTHSLRLYLDGRQDDGTVWVVRTLQVQPGHAYRVTGSVHAWSPMDSFNTLAYLVFYVGPAEPQYEEDFPAPFENSGRDDLGYGGLREPLDRAEAAWEPYTFTWDTGVLGSGTLHVAVGISAVWETEMTYFLDDLSVEAVPV